MWQARRGKTFRFITNLPPAPGMILRARIVLPVCRPPIEDGAVAIEGDRIVWVGRWTDLAASERINVRDLGETILLPGLINAHCHLDYTDMAGHISPPKVFSDWIKSILALKAGWSYADFAQSWLHGAQMLLRTGTTTVADVEAVPELIPEIWNATPLRVLSFREMISLRNHAAAAQQVEAAAREWGNLPDAAGRIGLSPHAPYSTTADLLRLAAHTAKERHWPLTTHVAESETEFEMFMHRRGALYDWLQSQRDMSDCGGSSPVQYLERNGYLSENLLAVHVNYLGDGDAATLSKRKVSIAHCPRSHAYFAHTPFPYTELALAGINVCLGTDSLASTLKTRAQPVHLNLFAEAQGLAARQPELRAATLLRMMTINGATALGRRGELGELSPNSLADLIVLPFSGKMAQAEEAVVHFEGEVAGSMIEGAWVGSIPSGAGEKFGNKIIA